MPIRLFFSHSSKDSALSEALVHLFQYATKLKIDEIRCTSVVPYNLDAGASTDTVLQTELRTSELVIGLLTRDSSDSYYVLAELGARWGIGTPFMLLRSSSFTFPGFSGPIANLSISSFESHAQLVKLAKQAAKTFGRKLNVTKELKRKIKKVLKLNAQMGKSPLEIHSAQWGSGSTFREISARVRLIVADYSVKTIVGCDLAACDPTPGTPKILKISYSVYGVKKKITVDEGQVLEIKKNEG